MTGFVIKPEHWKYSSAWDFGNGPSPAQGDKHLYDTFSFNCTIEELKLRNTGFAFFSFSYY